MLAVGVIITKLLNAMIGAGSVAIDNVLRSTVYTNTPSQNEVTINTNLSIGRYIVTVSTETGVSHKSIIEK
ncbi:MAG: hypothetical protein ACJA1Z_001008 [Patiriisocius sp.]